MVAMDALVTWKIPEWGNLYPATHPRWGILRHDVISQPHTTHTQQLLTPDNSDVTGDISKSKMPNSGERITIVTLYVVHFLTCSHSKQMVITSCRMFLRSSARPMMIVIQIMSME